MSLYLLIKQLHIATAAVSIGLFVVRLYLIAKRPSALSQRWLRLTPHINDSLLLGFAITLAIWSAQYPLQQQWLTAKVLALIVYIALASIALGSFRRQRGNTLLYGSAAIITFAYMAGVALARSPLSWLAL